jgi:phenylacetate-CoA ligase
MRPVDDTAPVFAPLAEIEPLLRGPRTQIVRLRDERLRSALSHAWSNVPFYRELARARNITEQPRDLSEWPTWNVVDLRDTIAAHPPFGSLYTGEGLADVSIVNSSTGTTGAPRLFPECRVDGSGLERMYRRYVEFMGITKRDVACVTLSYGLSRAAWSFTRAIESIGATLLPASSGKVTPPEKLLAILEATGATVLTITPSYLAHVTAVAKEIGFDLSRIPIKLLWTGGEAAAPGLRAYLTEAWGASAVMIYGNTDVSWVGVECAASRERHGELGMTVFEDIAMIEILDERGTPCPEGEYGELVVTSWARRSTPRIRFRTGDRGALSTEPCACGLSTVRMLPIAGRVDDGLRFHGQTIWPSAVGDLLTRHLGGPAEFLLELRDADRVGQQELVAWVDEARARAVGAEAIAEMLRSKLNVRFDVRLTPSSELAARTGAGTDKARRVITPAQRSEG